MSDAFATGGLAGVQALIDERAAPVIDEGYIYLLQAPDGAKLAGQLPATDAIGRLAGDRAAQWRGG